MAAQSINDLIDDLKDRFNLGSSELFGLDIGNSSVKLIKLEQSKGEYRVVSYAAAEFPEGTISEGNINEETVVVDAIKDIVKSSKVSCNNVCAGVAGNGAIAKKLQINDGAQDEIEDQVAWELESFLTFDTEKAVFSYDLLAKDESGGLEVMGAAVSRDTVDKYKHIVRSAGLSLKVLDLDSIALANIFFHIYEDALTDSDDSWLLLDIGSNITNFIIVRSGAIVFSKDINVGSMAMTEEIQRQMGLNFAEAEDLKVTYDSKGNLPEEILDIISGVAEVFFKELKSTLEFYNSSSSDDSLTNCYVTGGGAQTPGLVDGISEALGLKAEVLNPFNRIKIDEKKFGERVVNEIAYTCIVAMGLAMRGVDE